MSRDLRGELEKDDGQIENVPAWQAEVGDILVGTILRYEVARLKDRDGTRRSVLLAIVRPEDEEQKPVSLWISTTSLIEAFDEQRPRVGDRIGVKRLPVAEGKSYKRFRLLVDRIGQGPEMPVPRSAPERRMPSEGPAGPAGTEPPPSDEPYAPSARPNDDIPF